MVFGAGNDLIGRLWKNKLAKGCLVSAVVWFFFRYLFSLAAPFFLAFALITLLYPLLERIQKKIPIRKRFCCPHFVSRWSDRWSFFSTSAAANWMDDLAGRESGLRVM